jgi:hypothetical protein
MPEVLDDVVVNKPIEHVEVVFPLLIKEQTLNIKTMASLPQSIDGGQLMNDA